MPDEEKSQLIQRLKTLDRLRKQLEVWVSKQDNRQIQLSFFNAELTRGAFYWWADNEGPAKCLSFTELSQLVNILEQLNR